MKLISIEQQVWDLHKAGYSVRGIADEQNIDKSKVQRILKKIQESLQAEDDTAVDTPGDTPYDTPDDTGDTATKLGADTPFDTVKRAEIKQTGSMKPPVSTQKTFTLEEVQLLMEQATLYMLEYTQYVSAMLKLHNGMAGVFAVEYQKNVVKAQRLRQSARFLASQFGIDPSTLLVTQVLQSIQTTVENVMSGKDKVKNEYGLLHLTDRCRALQFWEDSMEVCFLHPSI